MVNNTIKLIRALTDFRSAIYSIYYFYYYIFFEKLDETRLSDMAAKRGRKAYDEFKVVVIPDGDKSFEELCRENRWLFELTMAYAHKMLKGKSAEDDEKKTDS
jgi:hypothetical protein